MAHRIALALAAWACLGGYACAFSESAASGGVTPPDWAAKPDPDQTAEVYPELANDLSLGGHVVLSCWVDPQGRAEHCRVLRETPRGLKFGAAALRLTPLFRFRPAMTETGPTTASVDIPVRFVPPPDDIRRAIPLMAILAAFTTALRWYRSRALARRLVPANPISDV